MRNLRPRTLFLKFAANTSKKEHSSKKLKEAKKGKFSESNSGKLSEKTKKINKKSLKSVLDEAEFIVYEPGENGRVFPANLSVKQIESMVGDKNTITDMLFSCNESNGLYIVPIKEAKLFFPDLVIKYYEERLCFG